MALHITFNNIRNSDAVSDHVNKMFNDLLQITDSKFPIHVDLIRENNHHHVKINCTYYQKSLVSNANHENLYKALSKSVSSIRTQVMRRSGKIRQS